MIHMPVGSAYGMRFLVRLAIFQECEYDWTIDLLVPVECRSQKKRQATSGRCWGARICLCLRAIVCARRIMCDDTLQGGIRIEPAGLLAVIQFVRFTGDSKTRGRL